MEGMREEGREGNKEGEKKVRKEGKQERKLEGGEGKGKEINSPDHRRMKDNRINSYLI